VTRIASDNSGLEQLIAQVRSAELAGVFARSRVDVQALMARPVARRPMHRVYEWSLVGLPLAACLAIVVGMATMFVGSPSHLAPSPLTRMDASADQTAVLSAEMISDCVTGPGMHVSDACTTADLDHDGDVDLLDYSSFQRQLAESS
jgi:hypothetical protein